MFKKIFKGFTLIELLVVIAIIAILAAILFPVFAQAREKARQTACLSGCKQIGTAIQLYIDDYDETLPGAVDVDHHDENSGMWDYQPEGKMALAFILSPYIKNYRIFACPSAGPVTWTYEGNTYYGSNKLWNGVVLGASSNEKAYGPIAMADIKRGSEIALFLEYYTNDGFQRLCLFPCWWGFHDSGRNASFAARHNGGENITYVDGHAKFSKITQIKFSNMGLKKKDGTDPQWYSSTEGGSAADVWNTGTFEISL